jgi:hypothetical protein
MEEFTLTLNKTDMNMIQMVLSNNFDYLLQEYQGTEQDKELLKKWLDILDKIEIPMKKADMLWDTTREYYTKGGEE